jgi:hypothetical protein
MKSLTRGERVTLEKLGQFIEKLEIPTKEKERLLDLMK